VKPPFDLEDEGTVHLGRDQLQIPDKDIFFPCLVVLSGRGLGDHHHLTRRSIVVGRRHSADITLRDRSVSRHHFRLDVDSERNRVVIHDLGSTNGTFVNGCRIPQSRTMVESRCHQDPFRDL
jgi:pSer/pThr/pTyr-binding forkhead associated (FHA) protein